ncbi:hypothetical protein LQF12_00895 [Ruania suaedae]|uniref:hypothetical protein n=1 Tax=Ruania suaedae TaxID=2897774 RepID=UPI001E35F6D7|nr:hypothetical protein [Ruania suaedae]UFU03202.1 hypothetical protein LQF12_00895 [Ruania suaedae]
MRQMLAGVAAAALLVLTACGASEEPGSPATTTPAPDGSGQGADPTLEPSADPDEDETGSDSDDLSEEQTAAVADLAERLDVGTEEISAGPLEQVTWPDGALGCPAAGQSYTQALVEGYRLILTHEGEEYAYHAGEDGELAYCADPVDPAAPGTEVETE